MIRVLPVLDVRAGVVVHGRAGQRASYKPIRSQLTTSTQPRAVAAAFRDQLGLDALYLADLDGLIDGTPNALLHRQLAAETKELWVDAGLRCVADAEAVLAAQVNGIVAALESLDGPDTLGELVAALGPRLIFSLDLRAGVPVARGRGWPADPFALACQAIERGVRRLLLLDVSRVGMNGGTGTEELCRRLAAAFPQVELATGGGIKDKSDLQCLQSCGVQVALVATALHDGRVGLCDWC